MNNPYYFPFERLNKSDLVPGEIYYIKLNDRIAKSFLDKRRNLPVSHLKGTFVRLHTEVEPVNTTEYAVFKDVKIMNKRYKLGLCNLFLVRYPEGFLAAPSGCDTLSDNNPDTSLRRTINEDREVFFNVNNWMFGKSTEQQLLAKQLITKMKPTLNNDTVNYLNTLTGAKTAGRKKHKKTRKTIKNNRNKHKISRNQRTRHKRRH
jgi:hypothetical protein